MDDQWTVQPESHVQDPGVDIVAPAVAVTNQRSDWGQFQTRVSGVTSAATAIAAGYLALAMQKWPDATANQVLQTLVYTTGDNFEQTELQRSTWTGWGALNLERMLATDPAQYPDVNPVLLQDVNQDYCRCCGAARGAGSPARAVSSRSRVS